jgi:hypothetical protein
MNLPFVSYLMVSAFVKEWGKGFHRLSITILKWELVFLWDFHFRIFFNRRRKAGVCWNEVSLPIPYGIKNSDPRPYCYGDKKFLWATH